MKIIDRLAEYLTDFVTIPPVITGNRLEIHHRLKELLEAEGVPASTSSWTDGCRIIRFPQSQSIKGSKGKKVK